MGWEAQPAYTNSNHAGELVAVCIGLYRSQTGGGYIHAGKKRLERAELAIGREEGDECGGRPGPVSAHSGTHHHEK